MRRWWLLLSIGCGRLEFTSVDANDATTDAAVDSALGADCWPAWRSGAPTFSSFGPIAELALPDKQGNPWLTADGLTLYFDSGTGDTEIFRAVRPAVGSSFGTPEQLVELTSSTEETSFVSNLDGTVGVISSSRAGSAGFDLWQLSRTIATGPFDAPTQDAYQNINTAANELDPYLTPDGLRVYFAQSGGGQKLYMASRTSTTAPFSLPVALPGAGTLTVAADPELSPDERVLVFAGNLPLTLFLATRASTLQPFGAPTALSAIVGTGYDGDPALSANGCELFYISDRGGDRDLYRAIVAP